jgi:hypothetical protein
MPVVYLEFEIHTLTLNSCVQQCIHSYILFSPAPARIANIMKKPAHLTPTVKFVGKGKLQSAFTADVNALPKSFPKGFGSPFYVAKKPRPLGCA